MLVVEVLSESTEAYDCGEKLDHYRQVPSLAAVVLVSHRERSIEVWERAPDGSCRSRTVRAGEAAEILAPSVRLVVDDLYGAAAEPEASGG